MYKQIICINLKNNIKGHFWEKNKFLTPITKSTARKKKQFKSVHPSGQKFKTKRDPDLLSVKIQVYEFTYMRENTDQRQ